MYTINNYTNTQMCVLRYQKLSFMSTSLFMKLFECNFVFRSVNEFLRIRVPTMYVIV